MAITASTLYAGTITTSGGTASQSITVPSGAEMLVVCFVSASANALSSMTFNGSGLTSRANVNDGNTRTAGIFDVPNPTAGTFNLVVNGTGSNTHVIVVRSISGINTSAPRGAAQTFGGFNSNRSVTLTTAVDDLGIDIIGTVPTLSTTDSRATDYNTANVIGTTDVASSTKVATTTSTVMNWTHTSEFTVLVAIPYVAATGGGGSSSTPAFGRYGVRGPIR